MATLSGSASDAMEMTSVVPVVGNHAEERFDELLRQYCGTLIVEELQVFDSSHHNLRKWEKRKGKSNEPWQREKRNEWHQRIRTGLGKWLD